MISCIGLLILFQSLSYFTSKMPCMIGSRSSFSTAMLPSMIKSRYLTKFLDTLFAFCNLIYLSSSPGFFWANLTSFSITVSLKVFINTASSELLRLNSGELLRIWRKDWDATYPFVNFGFLNPRFFKYESSSTIKTWIIFSDR